MAQLRVCRMSIWSYEDIARPFDEGFTALVMERRTCLYCKVLLVDLTDIPVTCDWSRIYTRGRCCPTCGWWYVEEILEKNHDDSLGGFARLRNLDLTDIAVPVSELRNYLLVKFESRFHLHPRLFEETVASIFRDIGYIARVTSYSRDNGIDVYLDGPDDSLIGVQVKRWKGSIKIEQIHALAGALIRNKCTEGVFVTTSSFQRGANREAHLFGSEVGLPIELIDSKRLYDALRLTTRPCVPGGSDPDAPWNVVERGYLWTDV